MNTITLTKAFTIKGTAIKSEPFGNGHINETLKITTDTGQNCRALRISIWKAPTSIAAGSTPLC